MGIEDRLEQLESWVEHHKESHIRQLITTEEEIDREDIVAKNDLYWHHLTHHQWGPTINRRGVRRRYCKVYGCHASKLPG